MARDLGDVSPLTKRIAGVRQRGIEDFPPKGWQDAGSEHTARDAPSPSRLEKTRGRAPGGRKG
jgi:hypothetical protein